MLCADKSAWLITNHAPNRILSSYTGIDGDIIAVDGGLQTVFEQKLSPKIIVGDLDSLNPALFNEYPDTPLLRHESRKNATDTELALDWCVTQGYTRIIICNDMQGRFDHCLAIVQNLLDLHRQGIMAFIESDSQRIFFIRESLTLKGKKGDLLSLVAYSPCVCFIASEGLEYPLKGLRIHQHQSRGISNVFDREEISLKVAEGEVLAIYTPL
ncbi:MAG: thiamine diphosphokinase [Candidatus Cloacimonetes bacterium]|jgi:thiamine pyrophosphokinase|nr:thiamine diphosphokinase [Candidatus Cloacimonadota bacterium]MDD2505740.1 thiamine diphosphokinase [Candidatus Cloacimonadota bacterium]MDD4559162.1 thiamine diphosphokinase [Candidatus Cloacimonadota bacterium]